MRKIFMTTVAALLLTFSASIASASSFSFWVHVNTAPLVGLGAPPAPFWLDFIVSDGGLGSGSNTFTASNFDFGSGNAVGSPTTSGGATGSLGGTVSLGDDPGPDFFTELYQQFVPGNSLSFVVTTTGNYGGAPAVPDQFTFSILQGDALTLANIPTTDPVSFGGLSRNALVAFDVNTTSLSIKNVGAFAGANPFAGVQAEASSVPEPTSLLLLGAGLFAGARRRAKRK